MGSRPPHECSRASCVTEIFPVSVSSVIICAEVTSRTERGPSITGAVLMLHLLTRRRTLIYRWASRKAPSTPENRLRNIMQTVLGRINLLKRAFAFLAFKSFSTIASGSVATEA